MVIRADKDAFLRPERCLVVAVLNRVEAQFSWVSFIRRKVALANLYLIVDDIAVAKDGAGPAEALGILTTAVDAGEHWTVTVVADRAQVPLDSLEEAECVNLLSVHGLRLLVIVEAANGVEQDVLQVLSDAKCLQELDNRLVLVVTKQCEVRLT